MARLRMGDAIPTLRRRALVDENSIAAQDPRIFRYRDRAAAVQASGHFILCELWGTDAPRRALKAGAVVGP